jgi:hypothetical protein
MKRGLLFFSLIFVCCACGSSGNDAAPGVTPLDPTTKHYGESYTQWAGAWVKWFYELPLDANCADPISDTTGERCDFAQDPASKVYFLAGNFGGKVKRTKCVMPADKALFMPILVQWHDNGGVAADMLATDAQLKAQAVSDQKGVQQVTFELDGNVVDDLEPFAINAAPYTYTVPPEPNVYSCQGTPGVTGTYSGYANGYFVLLPPLVAGKHTIAFSGNTTGGFSLNVSYDPLTMSN